MTTSPLPETAVVRVCRGSFDPAREQDFILSPRQRASTAPLVPRDAGELAVVPEVPRSHPSHQPLTLTLRAV